jgi:hypothetical protein
MPVFDDENTDTEYSINTFGLDRFSPEEQTDLTGRNVTIEREVINYEAFLVINTGTQLETSPTTFNMNIYA